MQNANQHVQFVHRRLPSITFGFPIPLPEGNKQNTPQIWPQYLFGRTRRGFFKEDRTPNILDNRWQNYASAVPIFLQDNYGLRAGMIQLHDSPLVSSRSNTLLNVWSELELVSISAGTVKCQNILDTFRILGPVPGRWDYPYILEFYNVMWIEWKGGVAYRKGLGKVIKEAWDRQATEWIDLTLG